jgi:hypothetical protein
MTCHLCRPGHDLPEEASCQQGVLGMLGTRVMGQFLSLASSCWVVGSKQASPELPHCWLISLSAGPGIDWGSRNPWVRAAPFKPHSAAHRLLLDDLHCSLNVMLALGPMHAMPHPLSWMPGCKAWQPALWWRCHISAKMFHPDPATQQQREYTTLDLANFLVV